MVRLSINGIAVPQIYQDDPAARSSIPDWLEEFGVEGQWTGMLEDVNAAEGKTLVSGRLITREGEESKAGKASGSRRRGKDDAG